MVASTALRDSGPGCAAQAPARKILDGGEFPTAEQLHAVGELTFLFLRGPGLGAMLLCNLRRAVEPAADTGQFAVLRQDGVPRAALSWAFLTRQAEARHLRGEALRSEDWIEGDRLWLMDVIAPYGQGSAARMMRFWHDSLLPHVTHYRFQRNGRDALRHVVATRLPSGRFGARLLPVGEVAG